MSNTTLGCEAHSFSRTRVASRVATAAHSAIPFSVRTSVGNFQLAGNVVALPPPIGTASPLLSALVTW